MNISQLGAYIFSSALFNHLWQSTAVVIVAWLLTVALRNNSARVRYAIWMFASIKFLVPFSLLARLGTFWPGPKPTITSQAAPVFYSVVEEFSRPLQQGPVSGVGPIANSSQVMPTLWIAVALVWVCGSLVLLARWISGWLRATKMMRSAGLAFEGREFNALRRAELRANIRRPVPLRLSSTEIEPGIFGMNRPVLLWPAGLSDRLDNAQVEAIMAHELEHVRRHDNLTAAIHAGVEAFFWFHPLLRWMSTKLNEERERACDESVMAQHAKPEAYAESILKVCAFCMEPPTPCVSGVSGAELKDRILRIMTRRSGAKMTAARKAVLYFAAAMVLAVPVGFGVLHGQANSSTAPNSSQAAPSTQAIPKYEVASIKHHKADDGPGMRLMFRMLPDGVSLQGIPMRMLLQQAFGVEQDRIVGEPSWANSSRYDIEAKVDPEDAPKLKDLKVDQRNAMMLQLLVDRFNLKYHHETRELPTYALVVAKGGSKLTEAKPGESMPRPEEHPGEPGAKMPSPGIPEAMVKLDGPPRAGNRPMKGEGMMMSPGSITSRGGSVDFLSHALSNMLGRTVVDETGLTGKYDFSLNWTPDENMPSALGGPEGGPPRGEAPPDAGGPTLFTALEEQLGLKLEAQKGKVDVIVIDHIDQPSQN